MILMTKLQYLYKYAQIHRFLADTEVCCDSRNEPRQKKMYPLLILSRWWTYRYEGPVSELLSRKSLFCLMRPFLRLLYPAQLVRIA